MISGCLIFTICDLNLPYISMIRPITLSNTNKITKICLVINITNFSSNFFWDSSFYKAINHCHFSIMSSSVSSLSIQEVTGLFPGNLNLPPFFIHRIFGTNYSVKGIQGILNISLTQAQNNKGQTKKFTPQYWWNSWWTHIKNKYTVMSNI